MATTLASPRASEKVTPIVTLLLVFLCGAAAGAVVMSRRQAPAPAASVARSLSTSVSDWKKQLDLSDEQTRELTSILDDFSHYYGSLLADGNTRILQILNESQKKKFEKMMLERKSR